MILKLPSSQGSPDVRGSTGAVAVHSEIAKTRLGQVVQMRGSATDDETQLRPEECARFVDVYLRPPSPPPALIEALRGLK
jgi:hypothetical protein